MASPSRLLGESPALVAVRAQVSRLLERRTPAGGRLPPVVILGETGTGKGLLASEMHRAGPRAAHPFIDLNCAAIPETLLEAELFGFERGAFTDARQPKAGLLQAAHRGTLFLDEVGLLPESAQAKLLKALEERAVRRLGSTRSEPVDVWLIAATSEDLEGAVRARRFREDLYHRLAVITLRLPPLRERGDDVLLLAEHFLARTCADYGLAGKGLGADARAALRAHGWPGNVRELGNVIERVALLSDGTTVDAAMLGLSVPGVPPPGLDAADERRAITGAALDEERARLREALRATRWNISQAAVRLGVPRNTLRYRMQRHGLHTWGAAAARPPHGHSGSAGHDDVPITLAPGSAEGTGPCGHGEARAPSSSTFDSNDPVSPADRVSPPGEAIVALGRAAPERIRWESRRLTFLAARLVARPATAEAWETGREMDLALDKVPEKLFPQQKLSPPAVRAHTCSSPLASATAFRRFLTGTGVRRSTFVPSPSWPASLAPQQRTVPSASRAHAWRWPAATATAPESPLTATGLSRSALVPSPTCPLALSPQQATAPPVRTAQVWPSPAATATASVMTPTRVGKSRVVRVPSPSWPWSFFPQQKRRPSDLRAHVCRKPPETATTLASDETGTGKSSDTVVPLPS
jgi:DNA-binding NtrC family response regulator